ARRCRRYRPSRAGAWSRSHSRSRGRAARPRYAFPFGRQILLLMMVSMNNPAGSGVWARSGPLGDEEETSKYSQDLQFTAVPILRVTVALARMPGGAMRHSPFFRVRACNSCIFDLPLALPQ